jgi:hypothetical protein
MTRPLRSRAKGNTTEPPNDEDSVLRKDLEQIEDTKDKPRARKKRMRKVADGAHAKASNVTRKNMRKASKPDRLQAMPLEVLLEVRGATGRAGRTHGSDTPPHRYLSSYTRTSFCMSRARRRLYAHSS